MRQYLTTAIRLAAVGAVLSILAAGGPVAAQGLQVADNAPTSYTVQKGDTLWKIATTSYGDGKQWQKIASANPGLSPSTLKVGQTILIP